MIWHSQLSSKSQPFTRRFLLQSIDDVVAAARGKGLRRYFGVPSATAAAHCQTSLTRPSFSRMSEAGISLVDCTTIGFKLDGELH